MSLYCYAPAKVNLFLDVLSKRSDGYHDIGTVFQTIDLGDELWADANSSCQISIQSNVEVCKDPRQDLIYRAADALRSHYGIQSGIDFRVQKNLPMGAGLGGGSSDAAAALRLATQIWDLPWDEEVLIPLAAKLGADVPFFLRGGTALAEGIGEKLTWIPAFAELQNKTVLVITPPSFVPTGPAYAQMKPSGLDLWLDLKAHLNGGFDSWALHSFNKFEEWVLPNFADVRSLKEAMLMSGADWALLSGSGASVFGVFAQERDAQQCLEKWAFQSRFAKICTFLQKNS